MPGLGHVTVHAENLDSMLIDFNMYITILSLPLVLYIVISKYMPYSFVEALVLSITSFKIWIFVFLILCPYLVR
jgi:hypothetical protein